MASDTAGPQGARSPGGGGVLAEPAAGGRYAFVSSGTLCLIAAGFALAIARGRRPGGVDHTAPAAPAPAT